MKQVFFLSLFFGFFSISNVFLWIDLKALQHSALQHSALQHSFKTISSRATFMCDSKNLSGPIRLFSNIFNVDVSEFDTAKDISSDCDTSMDKSKSISVAQKHVDFVNNFVLYFHQ